ncbi:MAG: PDZ domain-containing protein, partial [Pleurocapsa sp. SU_196_0]|nr:PDZ domain-containing protein [Pleurocapsa sp. SU_196_0]
NADNAERFGVPVHHGVLLEGVLTGLSAQSAGLQRGDVIASVSGQDITDVQVLPNITRTHKAGDALEVVYYRGTTRHDAHMELKPRPLQPEADSLETLGAQIQAHKSAVLRELDDVVRDFTEDEARFKPAPNAWSAQEVLAHLINTERDTQTMIASLENGNELEVFTGNMDARVRATVRRYPTTAALVTALKDTHAETVELVRSLPEHFLLRKAHVVRVQQNAEFDPSHTRHHFAQMQRAVAAARANAVPA